MNGNQKIAHMIAMGKLLELAMGTVDVVIDDKLSDMVFRAWGILLRDGGDAAIESLLHSARELPEDITIGD